MRSASEIAPYRPGDYQVVESVYQELSRICSESKIKTLVLKENDVSQAT
jgi:hypothetical protein